MSGDLGRTCEYLHVVVVSAYDENQHVRLCLSSIVCKIPFL